MENIKTLAAIPENFMAIPDYIPEYEINHNTFILNYKTFLVRYLSHGSPSEDTMRNYCSTIDNYIEWCRFNKRHPLKINEYEFTYYREMLVRLKMKKGSIKSPATTVIKIWAFIPFFSAKRKVIRITNAFLNKLSLKAPKN